jgi:hypothetical protein
MHKSGINKPDKKSSDPADVPMGSNRLSPSEQAKAIAYDVAIMEGTAPIMPRNRTGTIANLRKDSDEGRYAAPGYGDQGQFAGGSGSGGSKPRDEDLSSAAFKRGGKVKKMSSGGSASSRADGIAVKGKTRGKMC